MDLPPRHALARSQLADYRVVTRLVAVLALLVVAACAPQYPADRFELEPATFDELQGFGADDADAALKSFLGSCEAFRKKAPDDLVGSGKLMAEASVWQTLCDEAVVHKTIGARGFFEMHFTPFRVSGAHGYEGLFTGYYEPLLHGSRTKKAPYLTPIYRVPPDLTEEAYFSRAEIDAGALDGKGLEIAWVDDAVGAFFLHVQGSGRIEMDDGTTLRVGYAGKNGHPYESIGRILVDEEGFDKDDVTLFTIRDWLAEHPERTQELLERNPSYVFFRVLNHAPETGPIGAQGVPLTPERSMAVDDRFIPYGTPVWLDASLPETMLGPETVYRRMLIAQDRGGAIKGGVRGDVFFGAGSRAEVLAGHMKQYGREWLLVPNAIAAGLLPKP